jgi:hypothetical protein
MINYLKYKEGENMWGHKAQRIKELEKEIVVLRKELELCGWPPWEKEVKSPAGRRDYLNAADTGSIDLSTAVIALDLLTAESRSEPEPEKFEGQGGEFGGGGASGTWDDGGSPDSGGSDSGGSDSGGSDSGGSD